MSLDRNKLIKLTADLDSRIDELVAQLAKRGTLIAEKERIRSEMQDLEGRRSVVDQILLRQSLYLEGPRRVFVSTRLERDGKPPEWLSTALARVNELRELSEEPSFEFMFGTAREGADFHIAILEKIVDCSTFLVVVPARGPKSAPHPNVSRFVVEEIGAAYALAKPIVLAVESAINPRVVGHLLGSNWQRVSFTRDLKHIGELPKRLKQALEVSPHDQREALEKRWRIVSRLFR